ncbi:alpha/beta fold hydrolase [Clostridium sp.]|uniref:alpha/beta hydrolase n=1 Tax=Clostridium sp. TaxID=1506 RepID=UPI0032175344
MTIVFIAILMIVALILFRITACIFSYMVLGEKPSGDYIFNVLKDMGFHTLDEYGKLEFKKLMIKSKEGYDLRGYYLSSHKLSNKVIIVLHGYTANHYRSCQYIDFFLKEEFNILLVDQRGHGESGGIYATYGYYECEDLDLWVNLMKRELGSNSFIGIHGHSMGAATVLMYSSIGRDKVKFIIAEAPYSNGAELIKVKLKKYMIPVFPFYKLVTHEVKKKCKFIMDSINPIEVIKENNTPIMFIHGTKDELVPYDMSINMYNVKSGVKKLYIIPEAMHNTCYSTNIARYEKEVKEFLLMI